jgi:hypothetical protein
MDTYKRDGAGGLFVIKGGEVCGFIPAGHPRIPVIEKRAQDGIDTILSADPPSPPPPEKRPRINALIRALVKKGVITVQDVDDEE